MKNTHTKIIIILIFLVSAQTAIAYSADRSPFEEPINARDMHDYGNAKKKCRIMGIITTQKEGKVILQINSPKSLDMDDTSSLNEKTTPGASVYSVNDKIHIQSNGILHEFTLTQIKTKSIVLKGKNARSYEVEAR